MRPLLPLRDHPWPLALAGIAAQVADAITRAFLPYGGEANPLVASLTIPAAIGAKVALLVLVLSLAVVFTALDRPHIRDGLLLLAVIAGSIGFGANLSVLVAQ